MRQSKIEDEEKNSYHDDASWDIKRIGVALLLFVFLFLIGMIILPSLKDSLLESTSRVLGVSEIKDEEKLAPPSNEDAEKILRETKESISTLTVENITSSNSAVQNIIRNLQQLQKGDVSTTKVICEYFCKEK